MLQNHPVLNTLQHHMSSCKHPRIHAIQMLSIYLTVSISEDMLFHSELRSTFSGSSHFIFIDHSFCMNILALMCTGATIPKGSNRLDAYLTTSLFV